MLMTLWTRFKANFRNNPDQDALVYLLIVAVAVLYSLVCVFSLFLIPHCGIERPKSFPYDNPKFDDDPCRRVRYWSLLGLTPTDADVGRRMLAAITLASLIGYERRSPDRPAGIRTMAVTALGSCCFTISSIFAFESGTMGWDASRVAAAIPSGVGFLGSAIVFKDTIAQGNKIHYTVSGISTAASVWISAAVGVATGGGLYYIALYTVLSVICVLRFGPFEEEDDGEQSVPVPPSPLHVPRKQEPETPSPPTELTSLLNPKIEAVNMNQEKDATGTQKRPLTSRPSLASHT